MTPKTTKGLAEILKDYPAQSPEDWWKDAREKILDIFKDARDITVTSYCLHLEKFITIKTNPPTCECEECIKDIINGLETDDSDR